MQRAASGHDEDRDAYFGIRINDGEERFEDVLELRTTKAETCQVDGVPIPASSSTFAGKLPMKLYPIFSAHPIHARRPRGSQQG